MLQTDMGPSTTEKFASVNGINMYYEDQGVGTPLVILHGGMGTALAHWEPYLPAFSQEFRVIAPDSRGHGRTNNPSGEWSYRVMADDIAALIEDLELQKPNICGWSDGGQIAIELAMRYPGLASSYVVGAVMQDFSDTYLQMLREWGFAGPGDVDTEYMVQAMPDRVDQLRSLHSAQGPEYWRELVLGISQMWLTPLNYTNDDFQKIEEQMLFVIGDRDQFIPVEAAVIMFRLISKAELAIVPNADHSLPLANVKIFSDVVLEFLRRINIKTT